ncbi:MFS transporter [Novosphingobium lentum]|uniref:MFS transporter n=1 Tax=Novosphingobium lentum TaxID=145287 RepID=UPI0009FD5643|nr:MFS transporter [Novosphingobium lentum]
MNVLTDRPAGDPALAGVQLPRDRLALLFMVMLVVAAGNTAMQSVMPSIGTRLHIADVWVSLAYSWSALLWMGLAPFWARRSDRRGRKAMMALGLGGFALSFGLCGAILLGGLNGRFSGLITILLFAAARSLYGAFGSAAPPAVQAYVASRTSRAERTKALALVASSFGLGTVLGPALAPLLIVPGLGLVGPFAAFALIALVVLVVLRLRLPDDDPRFAARGEVMAAPFSPSSNPRMVEDHPDGTPHELPAAEPSEPGDARLHWGDRRLRPWLLAGLLGGHAQAITLGVVGFLLLDRLGLRHDPDAGAGPIGLVLMCGAFATLLAQWGLIPALDLGPRTSTLWGMGLCAVGTLALAEGSDLHTIATGFAISSMGFGLFRPGFTSGASLAVTPGEQGQAAGIVAAVNGAAYIVAPAIGVWLYGHSRWLAWGLVELACVGVLTLGPSALARDAKD